MHRTSYGSEGLTYIATSQGWVYAAFVFDAFSREIVGWQITNHMRASLARDALDMALSARLRAGEDVSGLIHHSDRGVQYRSIVYGESLAESDVVASVGSRGDSYDNAMVEALNSVFKAELIDRRIWPSLTDALVESSKWVGRSQHPPTTFFVGLPIATGGTPGLEDTPGSSGLKTK